MATPKWVVADVKALPNYRLDVSFADGSQKRFDASYLLEYSIFEPLRNEAFFKLAHVDCGTVVWNDMLDIAPEHLYEAGAPIS